MMSGKEKASLELQVNSAKDNMATTHAREMQDVKEKLRLERERANSLTTKLERASTEANLTKKELVISNSQLKEWERYTALLKDVDFESIPFHKLACQFEPATGLSFCLTDVVRERLREEECWFSRKTRTSGGRPSRQNEEDDGRSELGF
jgi:hypothetical protein